MEGVIAANLAAVRGRIAAAARAAGRPGESVALVAVSKTHSAEAVREALVAGHRVFGENRVQEAQAKYPALRGGLSRPDPSFDRAIADQQGQGRGGAVRRNREPSTGRASPRRWPGRWSAAIGARPA